MYSFFCTIEPETTKSLPNAECVYAFESLFCAG